LGDLSVLSYTKALEGRSKAKFDALPTPLPHASQTLNIESLEKKTLYQNLMPAGLAHLRKRNGVSVTLSKSSFQQNQHTAIRSRLPLKTHSMGAQVYHCFTGPFHCHGFGRYLASCFSYFPPLAKYWLFFIPLDVTCFPKGNFTQRLKLTLITCIRAPVLALWLALSLLALGLINDLYFKKD